jgi:hypothetical protein
MQRPMRLSALREVNFLIIWVSVRIRSFELATNPFIR